MGLDCWFKEDIRAAFVLAWRASSDAIGEAAVTDAHSDAYRKGYEAALLHLAEYFNLATAIVRRMALDKLDGPDA